MQFQSYSKRQPKKPLLYQCAKVPVSCIKHVVWWRYQLVFLDRPLPSLKLADIESKPFNVNEIFSVIKPSLLKQILSASYWWVPCYTQAKWYRLKLCHLFHVTETAWNSTKAEARGGWSGQGVSYPSKIWSRCHRLHMAPMSDRCQSNGNDYPLTLH